MTQLPRHPIFSSLLQWPPPIHALWLAIPIAILFCLIASSPTPPYDLWWPIVQGRALEQLGHIPSQNLYVYTLPHDAPFHNQPWLAQWLMWRLFSLAGPTLIAYTSLTLFLITLLATLSHALQICPKPRLLALCSLALFLPDCARWIPRTQMFATPIFALFLWALLRYLDQHLSRRAFLLLLAAILPIWANIHGSFSLAILLIFAALAGEALHSFARGTLATDLKPLATRWLPPFALAIAAPLLNPKTYQIYTYIVELSLTSHVSKITVEWAPLIIESPSDLITLAWLSIPTLLCLAAWRQLGWSRLFMVWGIAIMSFRSLRFAIWWPLLMLPILPPVLLHLIRHSRLATHPLIAPHLSDSPPALTQGSGPISAVALCSLLIPCAMYLPGLPLISKEKLQEDYKTIELYHPDAPVLSYQHPLEITPKLAQRGYPGRLYHDTGIAGYLQLMLTPDQPRPVTFVDQRIEMIPLEIWRTAQDTNQGREDWRPVFAQYNIQTALLNVREQRPLQRALEADSEWLRVAVDLNFVLYIRSDVVPDAWRDDPTAQHPIPPPNDEELRAHSTDKR